jgi:hypothetical protein
MANVGLLQQSSDDAVGVVLISDAGTDIGYRLAREFLLSGRRVVVTGRYTSMLIRILHGCKADQVLALAADISDPDQFRAVLARTEVRLGKVALVIDGRTGEADPQWPSRFHLIAASDPKHPTRLHCRHEGNYSRGVSTI